MKYCRHGEKCPTAAFSPLGRVKALSQRAPLIRMASAQPPYGVSHSEPDGLSMRNEHNFSKQLRLAVEKLVNIHLRINRRNMITQRFNHQCFEGNLWRLLMISLVLILFAGSGCSKKGPKYPEDHARFQRVVQAIKTLETAYINEDTSAFHELLLPLENLNRLEDQVQQDFAAFSNIHLDLTIDRIIIDGDRISAFVSWQGDWQRTPEEAFTRSRGHGVLLWSGTHVILLRGTEGDLPFGMANRPGVSS
jgi:hypothetical protein